MFTTKKRIYFFVLRKKYFFNYTRLADYIFLTKFISPKFKKPALMLGVEGKTIINDLSLEIDLIMANYTKNLRNEINRANKEGICFSFFKDKVNFVSFYNSFAAQKKLKFVRIEELEAFYNNIVFTKASLNGKISVMHAYYLDYDEKYATLLYSCSNRLDLNENINLIGWSNKGLHHFEIIQFKNMGLNFLDWGGVCGDDASAEELNIRKFKFLFGGKLSKTVNYYSLFIYLYDRIIKIIK